MENYSNEQASYFEKRPLSDEDRDYLNSINKIKAKARKKAAPMLANMDAIDIDSDSIVTYKVGSTFSIK